MGVLEIFMDIPSALAFMHATKECKLDRAAIKSILEDDYGYGLRTYERHEDADWAKLKKKYNQK